MAYSVTDTSFGGAVRVGPNFEASPQNQRVAAFWKYGPGLSLSPTYSYILTPFPAPNLTTPVYDVTTLQGGITNTTTAGVSGYLTLSNDNWPTSYQYTSPVTNQTVLQLDVPRCIRVSFGLATLTAPLTINVWGKDFYGIKMMERYVVPATTAPSALLMRKAFFSITNAWYSYPAGTAGSTIQVVLSTSNTFGLPFRLYGKGDVISAGGGNQVNSQYTGADPGGAHVADDPKLATLDNLNLATEQGFFENQLPTYNQDIGLPNNLIQTGGPVHGATARDVRGTFTAGPNGTTTDPNLTLMPSQPLTYAPCTLTFNYVVKGFANDLNNEYYQRVESAGNPIPRPGYGAGQVPYPILPNVFFNYPAGSYTPATGTPNPQRLPLILNNAMGVDQFYSEQPIP